MSTHSPVKVLTITTVISVLLPLSNVRADEFSYSFITDADKVPWSVDWSGSSNFTFEVLATLHALDDPSDPADVFGAGILAEEAGVNNVGAMYYNGGAFSAATSFVYNQGWSPVNLQSNGTAAGNQLFQIGVFNDTPTNNWFGTNLASTSGSDAFFLGGTEVSADQATQTGVVNLGFFDEAGTQLADFGNMSYNAATTSPSGYQFQLFEQTYTNLGGGDFEVSLTMDTYQVGTAGTQSFLSSTSFGTQTVSHNLGAIDQLVPGLGLAIKDAGAISISGANYDSLATVTVVGIPEPTAALLVLLAVGLLPLRRRRSTGSNR